jgi:hypothetical protein
MRTLIGLFLLGALFLAAAGWQHRLTDRLRDERSRKYGVPTREELERGEWSQLVLGRPSGAAPLPRERAARRPPPTPQNDPGGGPLAWEPASVPPDREHTVARGEILGRICQSYYDTARPRVVEAVAAYNDLASANDIREGQVLLLPDLELLFPERD